MTVLNQLNDVFQGVFEDDELFVNRTTSANDIEDWDSLMHVNLILTVEKEFGIRFASTEVSRLNNVGQLLDLIESKL